jgi:hypothetical protein
VLSIQGEEPPTALRLFPGSYVRIRITSSPLSTNKLYTPIAGGVDLITLAQGEPSVPMALRPDDEGLTRAYVSFESAGEQAGLALSTGGFGPRIELDVETGDVVRLPAADHEKRVDQSLDCRFQQRRRAGHGNGRARQGRRCRGRQRGRNGRRSWPTDQPGGQGDHDSAHDQPRGLVRIHRRNAQKHCRRQPAAGPRRPKTRRGRRRDRR